MTDAFMNGMYLFGLFLLGMFIGFWLGRIGSDD